MKILLANITQVFNSTLSEAISNGKSSEKEVAQILARHSACWPLPDEFLSLLKTNVVDFCKQTRQSSQQTQDFLQMQGKINNNKTEFLVFHHGNYHFYNTIPDEVLALKGHILFWADFSKNEFYTKNTPRDREDWLKEIPEKMLRYLCHYQNSERTITLEELYSQVWDKTTSIDIDKKHNSINVRKNHINTFAIEDLIITVSEPSTQNDKKVLRLRGQDKFKVGKNVSAQLCIIKEVTKNKHNPRIKKK